MRKKIYAVMVLAFALLSSACFRVVDSTEHCVETRYGAVVREKIPNGFDLYALTDATCFKMTDNMRLFEKIEVQTADSVPVTLDSVSFIFRYDPETVVQLFREKRSEDAAEREVMKAAKDGLAQGFATIRVSDLYGSGRAKLNEHLTDAMQKSVRDQAIVSNVFLGGKIRLPEAVENARIATMEQIQNSAAERERFKTDSIKAATEIMRSNAARIVAENNAAVYEKNKVLADMEVKKAEASAWAQICKGVTTCIIGGNVVDKFMSGGMK